MIALMPVRRTDRQLLWNLLQKYLHELSRWYSQALDAEGNYPYRWFDAYFTEPDRVALLILDDAIPVGFALVNAHSYIGEAPDHVLAEFTVFPMYRRRHLATEATEAIFARCPGRWEIKFNEKNAAARVLWTRVTARYAPSVRRISDEETVLCFAVE
jgi:predicted acetyltransferase